MAGWRHELANWLQFKAVGEAGVHVIDNYHSAGFFQNDPTGSDFAILPFVGTRLNLDAKVWPAAGLILGIWTSGQINLFNQENDITSSGMFDSVDHKTYRVGGHRLSVGLNLGFEF